MDGTLRPGTAGRYSPGSRPLKPIDRSGDGSLSLDPAVATGDRNDR